MTIDCPGADERTSSESPPACDISLIIPVLNEEEGLDNCFNEVFKVLKESGNSFEIIFVDDGSTDASLEKMLCLQKKSGHHVRVIQLKQNYGQLKAILSGLKYSRGNAVITYDSDLEFPPECIPKLAAKVLEGYDVASVVRKNRKDEYFLDRIFSIFGNYLINKALGIKQKDFGSVKGLSRLLVDQIVEQPPIHPNVYAAAFFLSKNFVEIPVDHQSRIYGRSKWSVFKRIETYFDIYTTYHPRPFQWMMVGGGVCIFLGSILGVYILYQYLTIPPEKGTRVLFDFFLILTGLIFIALSTIGEFVVRIFRKIPSKQEDYVSRVFD